MAGAQPTGPVSAPSFDSSLAHLTAELERLDLLLRFQVWRVRQARGSGENLSPFVIPEDEITNLVEQALGAPLWELAPLPPATVEPVAAELRERAEEVEQRAAWSVERGVQLRLEELRARFELTRLELDLLLVALAPEIDVRYGRLFAYLQDNVASRQPSINLAMHLLAAAIDERLAMRAVLVPAAPLLRHRILCLWPDPSGAAGTSPVAWLDQTITVDRRIVGFLLDGDDPDPRVSPYLGPARSASRGSGTCLTAGHEARLLALLTGHDPPVLALHGSDRADRRLAAAVLAAGRGLALCTVDGRRLVAETGAGDFAAAARLVEREARLGDAVLCWDGFDALLEDGREPQRDTVLALAVERPGLTVLSGEVSWYPENWSGSAPYLQVELPKPGYRARRELWAEAIDPTGSVPGAVDGSVPGAVDGSVPGAVDGSVPGAVDGDLPGLDIDRLAASFRLTAGQIADAVDTARGLARWRDGGGAPMTSDDLYAAARLHSNRRLSDLARRIEPHYRWDDIVLPPDQTEQLRHLCDQMVYRGKVLDEWGFGAKLAMGRGINALFSGPPGTGKTMAADIVANELGLDLYKIDLSNVVSKYIGETEKNLSRIFDEAETSNAILFFDEADALFGKRTEVRDSHDRYANLEVSYLLQKTEEYEGIVILASNLHKNMDEAFRRRMHFIVSFPLPGAADRRRIWEQIWPVDLPLAPDVDLAHLAEEVAVAGGNIRNIALAAAYLAASENRSVSMSHLVKAVRQEYYKIGKLVTGDEFAVIGF